MGLLGGIFPALRAAQLDPTDGLRHDIVEWFGDHEMTRAVYLEEE